MLGLDMHTIHGMWLHYPIVASTRSCSCSARLYNTCTIPRTRWSSVVRILIRIIALYECFLVLVFKEVRVEVRALAVHPRFRCFPEVFPAKRLDLKSLT